MDKFKLFSNLYVTALCITYTYYATTRGHISKEKLARLIDKLQSLCYNTTKMEKKLLSDLG